MKVYGTHTHTGHIGIHILRMTYGFGCLGFPRCKGLAGGHLLDDQEPQGRVPLSEWRLHAGSFAGDHWGVLLLRVNAFGGGCKGKRKRQPS